MTTNTIIYIITMGFSLLIYGGLTFLVVKKKEYTLISGFLDRPKEEQEYLMKNGYVDRTGKLLTVTFYLFVISFFLGLLPIPYAFEVSMAIFTLILLGGMIWLQKYEVPHKRKKMYWITGGITFALVSFVSGISIYGFTENEVKLNKDTLEITGMYGLEWNLDEIEEVALLDERPRITTKSNGFATSGISKGRFQLEEPYGNGVLFIKGKQGPFLYIKKTDDFIILNQNDPDETRTLYETLDRYVQ